MILSRAPLTTRRWRVRLACIRHAASVRPEPGSNSSLYGLECLPKQPPPPTEINRVTCASSRFSCEGTGAVRPGHGRIKNQGSAAVRLVTPGDVSGHTASAFRKREGAPENRVVAFIALQR